MTYADSDMSVAWRAYRAYAHGARTFESCVSIIATLCERTRQRSSTGLLPEKQRTGEMLNVVLDIIRDGLFYMQMAKCCIFHSKSS